MKFAILVLCGRAAADMLPLPEPTVIMYEQDAREHDTLLLCLLGGAIASFAATLSWRDVREKLRSPRSDGAASASSMLELSPSRSRRRSTGASTGPSA